jgi:hypothetical protein
MFQNQHFSGVHVIICILFTQEAPDAFPARYAVIVKIFSSPTPMNRRNSSNA